MSGDGITITARHEGHFEGSSVTIDCADNENPGGEVPVDPPVIRWCFVDESGVGTQQTAESHQELLDKGIIRISENGLFYVFTDGRSGFGDCDNGGEEPGEPDDWAIESVALVCTPEGVKATVTISGTQYISDDRGNVLDVQIRDGAGGTPPVESAFVYVTESNPGPYSAEFESEDLSSGNFMAFVFRSGHGGDPVKSGMATCGEVPVDPADPTDPADPVDPVDPALPDDPTTPADPDEPAAPEADVPVSPSAESGAIDRDDSAAAAEAPARATTLPTTGSGLESGAPGHWFLLAGAVALTAAAFSVERRYRA